MRISQLLMVQDDFDGGRNVYSFYGIDLSWLLDCTQNMFVRYYKVISWAMQTYTYD